MTRFAVTLLAFLTVAGCGKKQASSDGTTIRVAAASDLARAFDDVGKAFEKKTHIKTTFDFGSSGLLAKQIEQGAPFSLFAAANKNFVDQVVKSGKCDGS